MPQNVQVVFGIGTLVFLLIAIAGGNFKIAGAVIPVVSDMRIRAISGVLGVVFLIITLDPSIFMSPNPTPIPSPSPTTNGSTTTILTASTIVESNQTNITPGQPVSVSASCQNGDQLVGGGFSSDPYVDVYSTYPSGPSTWTVTAYDYGGSTPVPLIAYANCVRANFSFSLQIVQSDTTPQSFVSTFGSASVDCPSGTVLVGGGALNFYGGIPSTFSDIPVIFDTYANGNSWVVGSAAGGLNTALHAYAICAHSHAKFAETPSTIQSITGTTTGIQVKCQNNNELLTSGSVHSDANDQRFKLIVSEPGDTAASFWDFTARFALLGLKTVPSGTFSGLCINYQ